MREEVESLRPLRDVPDLGFISEVLENTINERFLLLMGNTSDFTGYEKFKQVTQASFHKNENLDNYVSNEAHILFPEILPNFISQILCRVRWLHCHNYAIKIQDEHDMCLPGRSVSEKLEKNVIERVGSRLHAKIFFAACTSYVLYLKRTHDIFTIISTYTIVKLILGIASPLTASGCYVIYQKVFVQKPSFREFIERKTQHVDSFMPFDLSPIDIPDFGTKNMIIAPKPSRCVQIDRFTVQDFECHEDFDSMY
jgi:hypothetical protein